MSHSDAPAVVSADGLDDVSTAFIQGLPEVSSAGADVEVLWGKVFGGDPMRDRGGDILGPCNSRWGHRHISRRSTASILVHRLHRRRRVDRSFLAWQRRQAGWAGLEEGLSGDICGWEAK